MSLDFSVGAFLTDMINLIDKIKQIKEAKDLVLIGIDGPCASGKTTLADLLARELDAQVIRADDFFLPLALKTPERLAEAGGNIHYERFREEIARGIKSGKAFEYGVYNCSKGEITEKKTVIPEGIIIVEGSYSLHQKMQLDYDFKIFVEAPLELRLERILERNGKEKLEVFKEKWIPMEDAYFDFYKVKENCDIVIE